MAGNLGELLQTEFGQRYIDGNDIRFFTAMVPGVCGPSLLMKSIDSMIKNYTVVWDSTRCL